MIGLEEFRNNAIARGLCEGYTHMWSDSQTKYQLFKLACDANSVEFMAKSLSEGWGLSTDFIEDKFGSYINGKCICEYKNKKGNGYTSTMLCKLCKDSFEVNTTLLCVLDTKTILDIPDYLFCKIYIAGDSQIEIKLGECSRCDIYVYGGQPLLLGDLDKDRVKIVRYINEKETYTNG